MRITAPWLEAPGTRAVLAALSHQNHRAYFVGGCVRNAVLSRPVSDIDIATDAHPQEVIEMAKAAGLSVVPTGLDHGTVTILSDGPHEVTTFRRDVSTDGRRATVAFSDQISEDAARRDFTMNALYADAEGEVIDPLNGLADAQAGRVRFIGEPAARIAEDALRILRFFRFTAVYGAQDLGLDPEGLAACAASVDTLAMLSRERVGAEVRKLLAAPDPGPAVAAMAASGVLAAVLPGADIVALGPLVHLEQSTATPPAWHRRLAALGALDVSDELRLSKAETRRLAAIRRCLGDDLSDAAAAQTFDASIATDAALIRAATLGQPLPPDWLAQIERGAAARFPLASSDLIERYGEGPALGAALRRLRQIWVESGFALDREALLTIDSQD